MLAVTEAWVIWASLPSHRFTAPRLPDSGRETVPARFVAHDTADDLRLARRGDMRANAEHGHFLGDAELAGHAAAPGFRFSDGHGGFLLLPVDDGNDRRSRLVRRAIIDPRDVRQDNQAVGIEHRREQARQLVIVGEHKFGDGDAVILVHDRQDMRLPMQHGEQMRDILVMIAGAEILLRQQNLRRDDAVGRQQILIQRHQSGLAERGENLPLRQPGRNGAARGPGLPG